MSKVFIPENVKLVARPDLDSNGFMYLEVFPLDEEGKDIGFAWSNFEKNNKNLIKRNLLKIIKMENKSLKNLVFDNSSPINKDEDRKFNVFLWEGLSVRFKKANLDKDYIEPEDDFVFAFKNNELTVKNKNDKDFEKTLLASSFINKRDFLVSQENSLKGLNTDGYIYTDGSVLYHCVGEKDIFENNDVININLTSKALKMDNNGQVYIDMYKLNQNLLKKVAVPLGDIDILLGDLTSIKAIPNKLDVNNKMPFNAVCIGKTVSDLVKFLPSMKNDPNFEILVEHAFLNRESFIRQFKSVPNVSFAENEEFMEKHYKEIFRDFKKNLTFGEFNILDIYVFGIDKSLYHVELNLYQAHENSELDISFGVFKVMPDARKIIKGFSNSDINLAFNNGLSITSDKLEDALYNAIMVKALSEELKIQKAVPKISNNSIDGFKFFNVAIKPLKYKA